MAPLLLDGLLRAVSLDELYALLRAYNQERIPLFVERHHEAFLQGLRDLEPLQFNPLPRAEHTVRKAVLQDPIADRRFQAITKE